MKLLIESVDRSTLLDCWVDDRTGSVLTLYGLVGGMKDLGYAAHVKWPSQKETWRFFVRTPEVLEACGGRRAERLLGIRADMHFLRKAVSAGRSSSALLLSALVLCACGTTATSSTNSPTPPPGSVTTQAIGSASNDTSSPVPSDDCNEFVPAVYPNGDPVGEGRSASSDYGPIVVWEFDGQRLSLLHDWPAEFELEPPSPGGPEARGVPAAVVAVGDPPLGLQYVYWEDEGCQFLLWVDAELTSDEMVAYVDRL